MSMIMGLITLSDVNIGRVIDDPPLVWRVVAPDDSEPYELARASQAKPSSLLRRLFRKKAGSLPDLELGDREGANVELDKAWHGIHYLLTGTAWAGEPPLNFLVAGGQAAGDIDVGYGPVRLYSSSDVKRIKVALSAISDDELRSRFRPEEMMKLEIYPEIWDRPVDEDNTLGYLMEYLAVLRDHVGAAAAHGLGLAVYVT
jgi:hypothetical protein